MRSLGNGGTEGTDGKIFNAYAGTEGIEERAVDTKSASTKGTSSIPGETAAAAAATEGTVEGTKDSIGPNESDAVADADAAAAVDADADTDADADAVAKLGVVCVTVSLASRLPAESTVTMISTSTVRTLVVAARATRRWNWR